MDDLLEEPALMPPAVAATDDALLLVFAALAHHFNGQQQQQQQQQHAAHSFTWFRTTLPLVCTRWQRLVLHTPALWACCVISPVAEGQAVKARRGPRQLQQQQQPQPGHTAMEALPGSSPVRGSYYANHSTHPHHQQQLERTHSESSTPNRGGSPVLGSSPESDSGSYWLSQYAPTAAASPRHISQRLSRLSATRQPRVSLSAHAVITWLRRHATAAGGIRALHIDLSHHAGAHDFEGASLASLVQQLPQLARVHMAGAVEGTDAYEPLARLRQLRDVELSSASSPCLDGGLLALCFLRHLTALAVSLDIAPAFPMVLADLPTSLQQLRLGAMWLDEMPRQLAECTGLTKVVLERCQIEANPLPLLLTLPRLASITLRTASPGSSNASLPVLLPMQRPQQQQQQQVRSSSRSSSSGASGTATGTLASSSTSSFVNTSITSLSLIDVGLVQLPGCVSQLVALQELQLALNHDLGLSPATCLPQELTCLSGLQALCLGNCSLSQLPPVVAALTSLTRLELQGNALSEAGFSGSSSVLGFSPSLRVLDLTAQGSGRVRMRGIPGWVGMCTALTELRLGCSCLGADGGGGGSWCTTSGLAAAGGVSEGQLRGMHRSSSDVGTTDVRHQRHQHSPARHGPPRAARSLGLGSASSAPPSVAPGSPPQPLVSPRAGPGVASGGPAQTATLQLQQLPALLPQLQLLVVEGGQWEQRAVRDALQLVRQLERSGSRLQLVLPL